MKHVIRIATHMIVSGACMLPFVKIFESSSEVAGYTLITMLLAAILYVLRRKAESFWVFLGCHFILLMGGGFLIPAIGAYKSYIAIWCFWILYSAILRLVPVAESLDEPGVSYVVVLAIAYLFICFLEGSVLAQRLSLTATALVFLLYLLYRNLEVMDRFILVGSFSNKVDEQGIRKLNNRLSLLYAGILGALLAIFGLLRLDGLWHIVSGWLRKFLRFLVSLIPMSEQVQPEEKAEVENDMLNMLREMAPEQEPSAWMQLIGEILRGIIAFAIVSIIIIGIIYAVIYVYRHFYNKKNREDGDKVIEALSFGDRITRERKTRFFERFERNPARRIRRIYKNRFKRLGARHISGFEYMSPEQQVQFLQKQGVTEENIEKIRNLYEKARYSVDLVTESEVEQMRTMM